eukprot:CAMPEP_0198250956 /NCGR_PEP_ID=MMETSP1447-20131203/1951_1 /TAXON_ID=420782 /ORGANISM="Chaetoceros dichaeta, Strain CCMP1751" /LENGTH=167 /DNA_ID=CAMNT_0043935873 /DNA_START=38 /DNA_END=541 /DNA_ORIENTATION=-
MKTSICIAAIAATEFLASGLAFMPEPAMQQMSHEEVMLELKLDKTRTEGDQMLLEDETRRESNVFSRQVEMMEELDDSMLINQLIESDRNEQFASGIRVGESFLGQHTFDSNLADEFRRTEGENNFANDLLLSEKLFDDIIARPYHEKAKMTRISERGNLRRQPRSI